MSPSRRRLSAQTLESRKLMAGDVDVANGWIPVVGDWDGDGIDQIAIIGRSAGQDGNDLLIVNNGDGSDFLEGNTAAEEGGGLWNDAGGTMNLRAVDAVMAEQGGGGVFNDGGTINIKN